MCHLIQWLSWFLAFLCSGQNLASCPDKRQLSSSAVAANISLTKSLEMEQAALLRDTLAAPKQFRTGKTWAAEETGNGLCCHYESRSLCAAVPFAAGLPALPADPEEYTFLIDLLRFLL